MDIIVQKREKFGKATATLRRDGLIPAELYGHGIENLHLAVLAKDFKKVFKHAGESTLVNVVVDAKKRPAMIYDVQYDPVTDEVVSIDFYQVRLDEKLKIKVPIQFVGEAPAIKDHGGLLIKAMSEVEIEAFPQDIPRLIEVDIFGLKDVGQSLYVKDFVISDKIRVLVKPETVVATATAKMTEEQEKELEAAAGTGVEAVKVETEEKKAERTAEKQAGEAAAPAATAPEPKK